MGEVVPKMMNYISHDESLGICSLKCNETETPKNDPNTEVLIKVEAAGVNRADLNQVSTFFLNYFLKVLRNLPSSNRIHEYTWFRMRRIFSRSFYK